MKHGSCLAELTREDAGHHGSALSDTLIRVELIVRLEAELLSEPVLNPGNSRGAADQDDFVDFLFSELGVLESLAHRLLNLLQSSLHEFFELGLLQAQLKVIVAGKREHFNLRLERHAKLLLSLLAHCLQAGARTLVVFQIDAGLSLELFDAVGDQDFVKVSTSQIHISVRGEHIDQAVLDVEHGHIERAATEVKHNDVHLVVGVVEAARHCRRRRLIDDAGALEASDFARMPRRLFLRLIEVSRNGDDGFLDLALQPVLRHLLHGVEHFRGDLFGRHLLLDTVQLDHAAIAFTSLDLEGPCLQVLLNLRRVVRRTNHSLGVVDPVFVVLGPLAHNDISIWVERDPGRHCIFAQFVGEDLARLSLWVPVADTTVCGT